MGLFRKLYGSGQESAEAFFSRGLAYAEKGEHAHNTRWENGGS